MSVTIILDRSYETIAILFLLRFTPGALGQGPFHVGHGQREEGGPPARRQRLDDRPLQLPDLPRGRRRDRRRRGFCVPRLPQVAVRRQGHPHPERV